MSVSHIVRLALVSAAILTLSGARALVSAQALGDIAKKEEERRKTIPNPAKVYTNKDLDSVPAAPPAQPSGSSASAKDTTDAKAGDAGKDAGSAADAGSGDGDVKDQKYWSGKIQTLRTQLDRDKGYVDAVQSRINALSTDFVNRDDPAQKRIIEADRNKALAELDRLKKAVVSGQKAIDDLQEAARRAGVPPGWLR